MPAPPPLQPNKPQAALAKQPPLPLNKPNPNALNSVKSLPPTNPQSNQPPASTAISPKATSTPQPQPLGTAPIKPYIDVKTGYFGKNIGTTEKEEDGDDRYNKNDIVNLKK